MLPGKGSASDWETSILDHDDLDGDGQDDDGDEQPVVEETTEDVVVHGSKLSWVDFIEDLHEHKGVEDHGIDVESVGSHSLFLIVVEGCIISEWKSEDISTGEEHNDKDGSLIDALTDDVSPHDWGNDDIVSAIGRLVEEVITGGFSSKSEGSEGVHDQVNPEHLNWGKRGFSNHNSSEEDDEHSYTVDCQLEL